MGRLRVDQPTKSRERKKKRKVVSPPRKRRGNSGKKREGGIFMEMKGKGGGDFCLREKEKEKGCEKKRRGNLIQ